MLQTHIAQPLRCVSGEALQLNDRPRMLAVTVDKELLLFMSYPLYALQMHEHATSLEQKLERLGS